MLQLEVNVNRTIWASHDGNVKSGIRVHDGTGIGKERWSNVLAHPFSFQTCQQFPTIFLPLYMYMCEPYSSLCILPTRTQPPSYHTNHHVPSLFPPWKCLLQYHTSHFFLIQIVRQSFKDTVCYNWENMESSANNTHCPDLVPWIGFTIDSVRSIPILPAWI